MKTAHPKTGSKAPRTPHLRASDIRGIAQLATQATRGVADISEGVHQSVWGSMGVPGGKAPGKTRGITRLVYQCVHGITHLVGKGLDTVLARLEPLLELADRAPVESPAREAVLAALNGVLGDRLAASGNPLATPMTLQFQGRALDASAMPPADLVTGKVVVLIHGLCMNDLQWHTETPAPQAGDAPLVVDHGEALAQTLGYTPLYMRYNTGLHTSQNGHSLSATLEELVSHWPVPVQELTVVAHSMGGLLTRSALHSATADPTSTAMQWPPHLKNIVFLGTPHHGAPLERAGNWVDVILGSTPYTKPFAKLGQLRSAGITDLRYGHVLDQDWQGHDRFRRKPDSRQHLPLPEGVSCFNVAATVAGQRSAVAERLIGDGLVPLNSALGLHDDARRNLVFAKPSQWVAYRMHHMELLSRPEVTRQILQWLTPQNSIV
jgi:pimeloyl-ACP methyl ester carboxylesterase